jgi:hypothetical protein
MAGGEEAHINIGNSLVKPRAYHCEISRHSLALGLDLSVSSADGANPMQ